MKTELEVQPQSYCKEINIRPRRNRQTPAIRKLVQENSLQMSDFIAPLFVVSGSREKQVIPSLPRVFRFSIDLLIQEVKELEKLGIPAVNLFMAIENEKKDPFGSEAISREGLFYEAIYRLKQEVPDLCIMVDIALDPYTDHGHDGLVDDRGDVMNDATLEVLGQMSLIAAEAGADIVSPSDMMDGRIGYIRKVLNHAGYPHVGILAYAAKYASSLYGPFRAVLNSTLKFGDKKGYQLNPANSREALREIALDEAEGADMLLVKPALLYLDILAKARAQTHLPIGAYHVSGEYAMVIAAARNGWLDEEKVMIESLLSIKRAGADFILSYASRWIAEKIYAHGPIG